MFKNSGNFQLSPGASRAGIVAVLLLTLIAAPAEAVDLKTAAQQSAPKYIQQSDGSVGGICVEIMQALEQVDPGLRFDGHQNFLPFKRLQHQLEQGKLDVFFGFKRTAARAEKFIFLEKPLYQVNYVIAARRDDPVSLNSLDDLQDLTGDASLATIRGSAASKFLQTHDGLNVNDNISSTTQLLKVLEAGRFRFAFYHDLGLQNVISTEPFDSSLKILPVSFSTFNHYVAFSKDTPHSTIARVGAALDRIRANGTLARIQRKYNLFADSP